MNSFAFSHSAHPGHPNGNTSGPRHRKKLKRKRRMRDRFSNQSRRARKRDIASIIRLLGLSDSNTYSLKQISYIFDMDPSLVERQFRKATGRSLKAYLDESLKDRLLSMLSSGRLYGYECASSLRFPSDQAFYHWVKRVFGETFRQLRAHAATRPSTEHGPIRP